MFLYRRSDATAWWMGLCSEKAYHEEREQKSPSDLSDTGSRLLCSQVHLQRCRNCISIHFFSLQNAKNAQNKEMYSEEYCWLLSQKAECIQCVCSQRASKHVPECICLHVGYCICHKEMQKRGYGVVKIQVKTESRCNLQRQISVALLNLWQRFGGWGFVSQVSNVKNIEPPWSEWCSLQEGGISIEALKAQNEFASALANMVLAVQV